MLKIVAPIQPSRGLRNTDAYGSGTFGASRDGGTRVHLGRDYIACVGDSVVAPADGMVTRTIQVYPDDKTLAGLEITGPGYRLKLLYVKPSVAAGQAVTRGEVIGTAQDVAAYWQNKEPRPGRMVGHVHLEVMVITDPERLVS